MNKKKNKKNLIKIYSYIGLNLVNLISITMNQNFGIPQIELFFLELKLKKNNKIKTISLSLKDMNKTILKMKNKQIDVFSVK